MRSRVYGTVGSCQCFVAFLSSTLWIATAYDCWLLEQKMNEMNEWKRSSVHLSVTPSAYGSMVVPSTTATAAGKFVAEHPADRIHRAAGALWVPCSRRRHSAANAGSADVDSRWRRFITDLFYSRRGPRPAAWPAHFQRFPFAAHCGYIVLLLPAPIDFGISFSVHFNQSINQSRFL